MRRLYLQIYLAFLGILLLFGILTLITWMVWAENSRDHRVLNGAAMVLGHWLPGPEQPTASLQTALMQLQKSFPAHFTVRDANGALVAAVGEPLPAPPLDRTTSRWFHPKARGPAAALALPDGRWVVIRVHPRRHVVRVLIPLGLMVVAIGLGAYPLARRMTRRLERLQARVDALGEGDLATRVEVEGRDEVATLAHRFNRAADRIERLVTAQRSILAGASHELRSPLARIRMAIELLPSSERPELQARLSRDIDELDELIGELLLASRLNATDRLEHAEEVDLLALLAEEGLRVDADVSGESISIQGDPRMLRRLIRNLLENAYRHADGTPIEASVTPSGSGAACLSVSDRGPGVPEEERERIFEPFYRPAGMRESGDGGIGLGLALVRQIAHHHGGDVYYAPRQGGGARFVVDLCSLPTPSRSRT